ncbi:MAG TPA: ROK family transcriptional regulator [Candidatus Limnocylindrales bacterium]|nr:ROK family transcriptional regulator [Candidatus Limnocylindrales bacterium]
MSTNPLPTHRPAASAQLQVSPLLIAESIGQRSGTVRRANLAAIVRELHLRGPQSRSELVARTGLTRTAIRALIGELVAGGVLTEERGAPDGAPGRPSPLVRPRSQDWFALALEIRVDSLAAALVGLGGEILAQQSIERPRAHLSPEAIVADLAELTSMILPPGERDVPIAIGVAVAGLVRRDDGTVLMAPNLGWRDAPLARLIEASLGTHRPVLVGNEADLGAMAELRRGAARGADDLVFVSGEVGVGGGIIVGGQPLGGVAGFAGEVGHMPVNPHGRACHCGSTGCWETEIGERALLQLAGRPEDGGPDEVDRVLTAAGDGDPQAIAAFRGVGGWLGIGLAGLVNVLNPRVIVLGGLFARAYPFIAPELDRQLRRKGLAGPRSLVRVAPADLGVDAPLVGAAELALEPFLVDPAAWLGPRARLAVGAGA